MPTYDGIMRDLKNNVFAPIYILMGDEAYYIDQVCDYIQSHALPADQQAFDQTVVFGADVSGSQIADLAMQFPMMAPKRVIIVKEAQGLRSLEKLERYAQNPQPKTILVICYKNGVMNKRLKLVSAVEKSGVVFESKKLREWQLPGHIRSYLQAKKFSIDDKSASMIADNVGADLNRLYSELDKLVISLPSGEMRITPEMVERNIGVSKDFNSFELRDAIVNRNILKANMIIKYFDNNPKAGSLFSFLPLLFSYFQNLMLAYYAPNNKDQNALAAYLDLKNVWGIKDYLVGMRNYTGNKTLQILQKLREIDAKSKGLDNPSTSVGVREAAIAAFVPEKFYTVALTLADGGTASSKRFAQKADAELLLSKCRKEGRVTVQKMERKEKSESPPQLYDLTALQRDANRLLGFTAQQTLDYAQSLYEKRLITYPRTDSRFLTEDMAASLPGLVTDTGRAFAVEEPFPIHVQQVINGSKVTDHHALLPTKSMANADLAALPAGERNVLRLIAARLLCAVGEPHRYAETTLTTICAGEEFTAKGKVVLSEGWKAMERKMLGELLGKQKEVAALPDVQEQSQCSVAGAELKEGQTSPPKHFTEDLLLHAMETASADSMPEGVERQGIGTPATRAATIEKLVQKGFLERKGSKKTKVLLPTDKGKALITVMPEEIQSPEMTADWETKLLQIERGEMEPSEFMTEINTMITELVKNTEMKKGANALMKSKIIGVCPNCGKPVVEREKGWFCENRECRFVLWKDNAFFKRLGKRLDAHVADKLLRDGRVRLKDCKSAKGKTYNATVLLSCEADGRSKFSLEFEGGC